MTRRQRSSLSSAFHLGDAARLGDALRGWAVDVAPVGGVARVLAEARLLGLELHAAPRRHRAAEQRAAARAQRGRVARRRVQRPRGQQQQGGAAEREREHGGGRRLAHGR